MKILKNRQFGLIRVAAQAKPGQQHWMVEILVYLFRTMLQFGVSNSLESETIMAPAAAASVTVRIRYGTRWKRQRHTPNESHYVRQMARK